MTEPLSSQSYANMNWKLYGLWRKQVYSDISLVMVGKSLEKLLGDREWVLLHRSQQAYSKTITAHIMRYGVKSEYNFDVSYFFNPREIASDFCIYHAKKLAKCSGEELVIKHNHFVGKRHFGLARQMYLRCLSRELLSRDLDSSVLFEFDEKGTIKSYHLSFFVKILTINGQRILVPISTPS
jgi:hypothetical protein